MFCEDFIFNNEFLSDHGLMLCSFDGSEGSMSGGDVTFITSKPPSTDRFSHYATQMETPISMNFQICKMGCDLDEQSDYYFTQDEQSYIYRWLQRLDGYHWLAFEQDGWEDVWFNAQFNLQPIYLMGHVIGYDCTVLTDSPYAYSQEYSKQFDLNSGQSFVFKNYSDIPGIIYPYTIITPKTSGTVKLESGCDGNAMVLTEITNSSSPITLDGNNDYIDGIGSLDYFNFQFPVLANTYDNTDTYFKNNGDIKLNIKIKYRYIRRVQV